MTFQIRQLSPAGYPLVTSVIDRWWGGRPMAGNLPRLFFEHFTDTSFAAEPDGRLAGFLAGFTSQSRPGRACITLPAWTRRNAAAGWAACSIRRSSGPPRLAAASLPARSLPR
jgi:hypothetical protein